MARKRNGINPKLAKRIEEMKAAWPTCPICGHSIPEEMYNAERRSCTVCLLRPTGEDLQFMVY